MDARYLQRIDDFLATLGGKAVPSKSVPSRQAGPARWPRAQPGFNPWRTEGAEIRLDPTPAQVMLIERLIDAQIDLDPDRMYAVWSACALAYAARTNWLLLWDDQKLSVIDWFQKAWIATVEAAKLVNGYVVAPGADLASERWNLDRRYEEELRPLIDRAKEEWIAQGGDV